MKANSATKELTLAMAAGTIEDKKQTFLIPFIAILFLLIDKRLVDNFVELFSLVLRNRSTSRGLWLSELGRHSTGTSANSATKRIHNLLACPDWDEHTINDLLFGIGCQKAWQAIALKERPLVIWDESAVEKPDSIKNAGICKVHSSKATHITKQRKGLFNPPNPHLTYGYKWSAAVLSTRDGENAMLRNTIWTSNEHESGRKIWAEQLAEVTAGIGNSPIHVMDRGYCSINVLSQLRQHSLDFIIRWKKGQAWVDEHGNRMLMEHISKRHRGKSFRMVREVGKTEEVKKSVAWTRVTHSDMPDVQLYLVIERTYRKNRNCYYITSLPVSNEQDAWNIVYTYMRRWRIEEFFRFQKAEMGYESIRLLKWDRVRKMLAVCALVYSFLMTMLYSDPVFTKRVISRYCPVNGKRGQKPRNSLYRIRAAIFFIYLYWYPIKICPGFVNPGQIVG